MERKYGLWFIVGYIALLAVAGYAFSGQTERGLSTTTIAFKEPGGAETITLGVSTLSTNRTISLPNGAPTNGYIIQTDASGNWNYAASSATPLRSYVWLQGANGYGSTNTKIRRFSTVVANVGSAITLTQSSTNGDSFTINENGLYAISYSEEFDTDAHFGISLNSTQLTTGITSITDSHKVTLGRTIANGKGANVSTTIYLPAGSVIRAHTNGDGSATTAHTLFQITQVGT